MTPIKGWWLGESAQALELRKGNVAMRKPGSVGARELGAFI